MLSAVLWSRCDVYLDSARYRFYFERPHDTAPELAVDLHRATGAPTDVELLERDRELDAVLGDIQE